MSQLPGQYPGVLWALAVWREARGESRKAKLGVAYVIRNRVLDAAGRWPKRFVDAILQPWQFSSFVPGDPNAVLFPRSDDKAFEECCDVVDDCAMGAAADPTAGANHYHSFPASAAAKWPTWATPARQTAIIGELRFYKL